MGAGICGTVLDNASYDVVKSIGEGRYADMVWYNVNDQIISYLYRRKGTNASRKVIDKKL